MAKIEIIFKKKKAYKYYVIALLILQSLSASASQFNDFLNNGKWANAKIWLINNRANLSIDEYYIRQIHLCHLLNEQEIGKAYLDSIVTIPNYLDNDLAIAHYNLGLSRYSQYHKRQENAVKHAKLAYASALKTTDIFIKSITTLQLAFVLIGDVKEDLDLAKQRTDNINTALNLSSTLSDDFYFLKAKVFQLTALIWASEFEKNRTNKTAFNNIIKYIKLSNQTILKHKKNHPQLVHNLTILGYINVDLNVDTAISYYMKADNMLNGFNDGGYGIFLHSSRTINHLLDAAYEIKFNKTQNVEYLNRALIWAKQNLLIDYYKLQYEGYYFYRRYNNRENPPIEQRITKLYFKLYNYTNNKNYLNFALKYTELMRHRPIMQIGINQQLYAALPQMAEIENGKKLKLKTTPNYFNQLITQPEYVSQFVGNTEALITFFCFKNNSNNDTLKFMVECIEQKKQQTFVLEISKKALGDLPEDIFNALEKNDLEAYKAKTNLGYTLFLKPVLSILSKNINHLIIIPPAYFNRPLLFEGFLMDNTGDKYANFNYVFDHFNISYANSFTHFVTYKKKEVLIDKVTVWNPDYTHTNLAEITESKILNKNISEYYNIKLIHYKNKKELTKGLLESNILHISAHANASLFNTERPTIYTALDGADSVLYDIDFEQLNSNNSLAIFAACKSNVGEMQHNGIIDGFTRAALSAGVAGTVSALRNVEESKTTQLLTSFYKHLASGNSASDALYLAKKEIKLLYNNPADWQSFIYTGADQTFKSNPFRYTIWIIGLVVVLIFLLVIKLIKPNFYRL
ncbi:MAG: CHAT domain-containing protein [Bacteroidia bacterium]|nr:CHAT domain-containing protein [Bacteroidia bacterium]